MGEATAAGGQARVGVLGEFRARTDDGWVPAPTRQVARVGTVLAGWPGEVVPREQIIAAVWGDGQPSTVVNTLQVHVSQLRRLLGRDVVRSSGLGYLLDVDPEHVDAGAFDDALARALRLRREGLASESAAVFEQALALWRGTPFPDVADPDLIARRARLSELRVQAQLELLRCRLELAADRFDADAVVAQARELVTRHPELDGAHHVLVDSLAAAGRPREAMEARRAARDLGLLIPEPEPLTGS